MQFELVRDNLLSPPILFFGLGAAATFLRSDLEIARPVARFLSLYLLFAIGFHGGYELSISPLDPRVAVVLATAVTVAALFPLASYWVLRRKLDPVNAAAIAATYGSISAVTYITAAAFLDAQGVAYSGWMVACMALMESPAIVTGVLLARLAVPDETRRSFSWKRVAHEATCNGAVFLLLGSFAIGFLSSERGWQSVAPIAGAPFQGVLCLFLLDMGLVAAQRVKEILHAGRFLIGYAILGALAQGMVGLALAWILGLPEGDALLFSVLCGSASYIAVPAAMRIAMPQANPSLYLPMALTLTFPFNITLGIPLYMAIIAKVW